MNEPNLSDRAKHDTDQRKTRLVTSNFNSDSSLANLAKLDQDRTAINFYAQREDGH